MEELWRSCGEVMLGQCDSERFGPIQTPLESSLFFEWILMSIWVPFWSVLGCNLTSKIDQKLSKNCVKMHLIGDIVFGFVFGVISGSTWIHPESKKVDFPLCFIYFLANQPL